MCQKMERIMTEDGCLESHSPKAERTKRLIAGALMRMLETMPLDRITVASLARESGLKRQTVYYHFAGLPDVGDYLFDMVCEDAFPLIEASTTTREFFDALTGLVGQNKAVLKNALTLLGRARLRPLMHAKTQAMAMRLVESLLPESQKNESRVRQASEYCLRASANLLESWVMGDIDLSVTQMSKMLDEELRCHVAGLARQ